MKNQYGVVIVGAGRGERLGRPERKAMVPLAGVPMILRTAEAFVEAPGRVATVLVVHPGDREALEADTVLLERLGVTGIVPGGDRRQDSVAAGVGALPDGIEWVLVHDAARPFVSMETILGVATALESSLGSVPAVGVTSTVKKVSSDGLVVETVPRDSLTMAQTPQGVHRETFLSALEQADRDGIQLTDDVQAIELMGGAVQVVEDDVANFKITTPGDLERAEYIWGEGS